MKFSKKLAAFFAVIPMLFGLVLNINAQEGAANGTDAGVPEGPFTIIINPANHIVFEDEELFTAYKILNIENYIKDSDPDMEGEQTIYGYSVADGFDGFSYTAPESSTTYTFGTDEQISDFIEYISGLSVIAGETVQETVNI